VSNRQRPRRPAPVAQLYIIGSHEVIGSLLTRRRAFACLDCDSIVVPPRTGRDGIVHVEIQHDSTCPQLRQMSRRQ